MSHDLRAPILIFIVALAAPSLAAGPAFADDTNGFPVCTAAGEQFTPVIVPDGAGGVIVAWQDLRPTVPADGVCFAQRVNATGAPQWAANGVALSTTGDLTDPTAPAIASDGAGGAFVAFGGNTALPRAQWVNAAGVPQWGADGVPLTNAISRMRDLAIARDVGGAGGAIVVWRQDNGVGGLSDIYAQKVNAAGAVQWGAAGVAVTTTSMNAETLPVLISDGAGGAIIAWFLGGGGCRAQRLNASGVAQWGNTPLSSITNNRRPAIVSDGGGGAVVAWAGSTGIFAQRVTSLGNKSWNPSNTGVQLSTTGIQCAMIPDGAGGATVAWQDNRVPSNMDIFAQRVNGVGTTQWIANGVEVCQFQGSQLAPTIVSDGGTGAIITWYDGRTPFSGDDIYAQLIDANGASQWTANGVGLCTAANAQQFPTIAMDGAGGAFVTWQDLRGGATNDIYLHHLNGSGQVLAVPGEGRAAWTARAWPNPFLDRVQLALTLPAATNVRLEVFDVRGRSIRAYPPELLPAGNPALTWDGFASDGRAAGQGIYFLRATGPGLMVSRRVIRLE